MKKIIMLKLTTKNQINNLDLKPRWGSVPRLGFLMYKMFSNCNDGDGFFIINVV